MTVSSRLFLRGLAPRGCRLRQYTFLCAQYLKGLHQEVYWETLRDWCNTRNPCALATFKDHKSGDGTWSVRYGPDPTHTIDTEGRASRTPREYQSGISESLLSFAPTRILSSPLRGLEEALFADCGHRILRHSLGISAPGISEMERGSPQFKPNVINNSR